LEFINPDLTDLSPERLGSLTFNPGTYTPTLIEDVSFQSGLTGEAAADGFENQTVEQYTETFGRAPAESRVQDGRVQLTTQEIQQFLQRFNTSSDLGINSAAGVHTEGTPVEDATIDVSVEGQQAVAAAIIQVCPEIPRSWAGSPALYTVMARESGGQVGRPNYALKSYMDNNNISKLRLRQDIRLDRFYSSHCCRLKNSSDQGIANRVLSEPGGGQCNAGTQSGLMNHTRAQAAAGVRGYGHISGHCASAAGIGQLLIVNMETYQPSGVQGYGNVAEEVCGMLKYIKSRHQTPEGALANYEDGIGY